MPAGIRNLRENPWSQANSISNQFESISIPDIYRLLGLDLRNYHCNIRACDHFKIKAGAYLHPAHH